MRRGAFTRELEKRAGRLERRIAFPEADDPRIVEAAAHLARRSIVRPVLVVDAAAATSPPAPREAGVEIEVTTDASPLQRAVELLNDGSVDGVVAGAVHTSAEVIRAGLRQVGLRPGVRTLSSCFFMEVDDFRGHGPEVLTFTDAGVVTDPGPDRLVEIATEAVRVRRRVVGDEPRVAFLSYSTRGSAGGKSVRRVKDAIDRFREACPEVIADGELQADAALIPGVAHTKAPDSVVGGEANVLVFPGLDAGNIAYKLVQRLAGALALGPILQGLKAPLNDLSRGASPEDIAYVAAITALMADGSEHVQ